MEYKQQKQDAEGSDYSFDKQLSAEDKSTRMIKAESWYWFVVKIIIFISILVAALSFLGVYIWHMIAPPETRWLTDPELEHMRSFTLSVVSGVIATVVTNHYLNRK